MSVKDRQENPGNWEMVRSDLYQAVARNDRVVFTGYGAGHGIGLCQTGAAAMAKAHRCLGSHSSYWAVGVDNAA